MNPASQRGFTLIEICVAIAIVAMGILTAMSILGKSLQWATKAKNNIMVVDALNSAIDYVNSGQTLSDGGAATDIYVKYAGVGTIPGSAYYFHRQGPYEIRFAKTNQSGTAVFSSGKLDAGDTAINVRVVIYNRIYDPTTNAFTNTLGSMVMLTQANFARM